MAEQTKKAGRPKKVSPAESRGIEVVNEDGTERLEMASKQEQVIEDLGRQ